jgi:GNAT superfamily N-acetyltransferase
MEDAPFVRTATLADAPRADQILYACLREHGIEPDPGEEALALHPACVDRVAQIGEELVGFASMLPHTGSDGQAEGWVNKLFVDSEYRRRGVAALLMTELEHEARARKWGRLGLSTRTVFREAIAFYESRGWIRGPARHHRHGRDRTYFLLL